MTNSPTSNQDRQHTIVYRVFKRYHGAATLLFSTALLTLSALLIIFAARYGTLQDKSVTNLNRSNQAYEAAQAGINFGINYLRSNASTVLANNSGGYLLPYTNSSVTNVTLGNSSKFSVTYANPVANDYNLITISATGTSDDGTSTKTISQQVQFGSLIQNPPTVPLLSKGNIDLGGNSEIINTHNDNTIITGGTATITGSATTTLSSGESSNASTTGADISQNNSTYSSMSDADFFKSIFSGNEASIQSASQYTFTNSGNTDYKPLIDGLNGTSIWINQTSGEARFTSNMELGTASDPVLLIIDGDVKFSGNVTIYGYVFILGSSETDLTGNVTIIGGVSTSGSLDANGSIQVVYNPDVLTSLQNNPSLGYYARVPGTWRDF